LYILYFNKFGVSQPIFIELSSIKFVAIYSAGAEMTHADRGMDGRTDIKKLIGTFMIYTNALKNNMFGTCICSHTKVKGWKGSTKYTESYSQQSFLSDPTE
jgi:hypothetical protein